MKESLKKISSEFLFENLPIGLMTIDENTYLLDANAFIFNYFNQGSHEVKGKRFGNVFHCSLAEKNNAICGTLDKCNVCDIRQGITSVLENGIPIKDVSLCHSFQLNGRTTTKWFTINASRVENDGEKIALVAFTDITNIKETEHELFLLGITDALTGLYNRRFMLGKLENFLNNRHENNFPISVAMVDIDHFKYVNDTFGHSVGDDILILLSNILKKSTRNTDYVCRYGGEEFIVIFTGASTKIAKNILTRINELLVSFTKKLINREVTFSAGLKTVEFDDNTILVDALIEETDRLLYTAKENGRNRIEF